MNKATYKKLKPIQQYWYANIMIDMVLADGHVHPSERKYLGLIFELFAENPKQLAQLKEKSNRSSAENPLPIKGISHKLSLIILQDCVDTAISDAEFHENEEKLLSEIGQELKCTNLEIQDAVSRGKRLLAHLFAFAG